MDFTVRKIFKSPVLVGSVAFVCTFLVYWVCASGPSSLLDVKPPSKYMSTVEEEENKKSLRDTLLRKNGFDPPHDFPALQFEWGKGALLASYVGAWVFVASKYAQEALPSGDMISQRPFKRE